MDHERLSKALATLNDLLSAGYEYPDAEYKAARQHKANQGDLRAAYDAMNEAGDHSTSSYN